MLDPATVAERAKAIRLSTKALARLAGRPENTVSRALLGRHDTGLSLVSALSEAIIAEERRLLTYLAELHGRSSWGVTVRRSG
jgi:hypothetical protein